VLIRVYNLPLDLVAILSSVSSQLFTSSSQLSYAL